MKKYLSIALAALVLTACCKQKQEIKTQNNMNQELTLTQEWDKVFPQSDKVDHKKVTFKNRFGITAYENMTGEKVNLQGQDANLQPLNEPLAEPFIVTRGNKQLYIVPNATHCDIYDGGEGNYIPFDYLENFYKDNLK